MTSSSWRDSVRNVPATPCSNKKEREQIINAAVRTYDLSELDKLFGTPTVDFGVDGSHVGCSDGWNIYPSGGRYNISIPGWASSNGLDICLQSTLWVCVCVCIYICVCVCATVIWSTRAFSSKDKKAVKVYLEEVHHHLQCNRVITRVQDLIEDPHPNHDEAEALDREIILKKYIIIYNATESSQESRT